MILPDVRAALVSQIDAATTCPVRAVHPGEDQPLRECVWIQRIRSSFEWRSLGAGASQHARNRKETLNVELRIGVYREGPDQGAVAAACFARAEAIAENVETAIDGDQSIGNTVSAARLAEVSIELVPRDQGWSAIGLLRVEAMNYPA